jgi:hypothetical protein
VFRQIVNYIGLLFAVVVGIRDLVEVLEVPGNGEEKKKRALEILGVIYDAYCEAFTCPIQKEKFLVYCSAIIDIIVAFLNAVGIFQRSKAS